MVKLIDKPNTTAIPEKKNGTHPAARDLAESVKSEEDAVRVVRTLIESSRIREAREKTEEFLRIWPDSRLLQNGKRILAPGVAKVVPSTTPKRNRDKENQWLREHAREYPGQWVLVLEDRLIAAGTSLEEVLQTGRATEGGSNGVLWFQPDGEWWLRKNT